MRTGCSIGCGHAHHGASGRHAPRRGTMHRRQPRLSGTTEEFHNLSASIFYLTVIKYMYTAENSYQTCQNNAITFQNNVIIFQNNVTILQNNVIIFQNNVIIFQNNVMGRDHREGSGTGGLGRGRLTRFLKPK